MTFSISGVIWNKDGKSGANEALAARLAQRELARMAEARVAIVPPESEAA